MLMETLGFALSRKRPHEGLGEEQLAAHVERLFAGRTKRDAAGNVHLDLRVDTSNKTLFVAHMDTVHREDGKNKIVREVGRWSADKAPLGADDGAGVAMLCHLASNEVPAYYVFTRGEEVGGVGAKHLADYYPDLLRQFDRAVAFDRRGIDSVITHQYGGRCASDTFADALSDKFNMTGLMYLPDDTGVYTDTAEFTHLIPECTNISCGYDNEHSARETLDVLHLQALAQAALSFNWDELPAQRDPLEQDPGFWRRASTDDRESLFELCEALEESEHGDNRKLVRMVGTLVFPEDVTYFSWVMRDIRVPQELIDEAFEMMDYESTDEILYVINERLNN